MNEQAFRKPTEAEQRDLERARKLIREGVQVQKDRLSNLLFPADVQMAKREERLGRQMLDQTDLPARNYDAYQKMTYMKKGGSVGSASKRADGIAQKGKTKGRFV
ncbi:MAG: hypothetical protein EBX64_06455 [Betaproteobacteria bacterium]|jgi:hypothetical protein|nr:hypothetical protein [Betaproteobacteria bacterium]